MKGKRLGCLLLSGLFAVGCLTAPAGAVVTSESVAEAAITRATGQFEVSIPVNTIAHVGDSFILNKDDVVSYDCTYTPRDASVKFGYIAPDGLFYYLRGSNGAIDKGIRVSQYGTYTLAIKNDSDVSVTVKGSVEY